MIPEIPVSFLHAGNSPAAVDLLGPVYYAWSTEHIRRIKYGEAQAAQE